MLDNNEIKSLTSKAAQQHSVEASGTSAHYKGLRGKCPEIKHPLKTNEEQQQNIQTTTPTSKHANADKSINNPAFVICLHLYGVANICILTM